MHPKAKQEVEREVLLAGRRYRGIPVPGDETVTLL